MKKCWLNGKTVIVTGGGSGIGGGISASLVNDYGCRVIAIVIDDRGLDDTIAAMGDNKDNFSCLNYDVSKRESWAEIRKYLEENGIQADVIINNAGILPRFDRYEHMTAEMLERCMNIDFYAVAYSVSELYEHVKKSPTPAFITVSSGAALAPVAGTAVYTAAKSASKGFTECFAAEHPELYVAYICPGFTRTGLFAQQSEDMSENKLISKFMSKRENMVKSIVRGIKRKKRRMIFGADVKIMFFLYKLFPRSSPKFFRWIMKISKQKIFDGIFDDM